MIRRRRPMPAWWGELMKELTRPPYFLDAAIQQQATKSAPPPTQESNGGSSDSGTGDAPRSHTRPAPAVGSRRAGPSSRLSTASEGDPPTSSSSAQAHDVQRPHRAANDRSDVVPAAASATADKARAADRTRRGEVLNWQLVFKKAGVPTHAAKAYGWTIQRALVESGVLRVQTAKQTYALKRTETPPERIEFLNGLFEFVREQGFQAFAPIVHTRAEDPYLLHRGRVYYATRWVDGNPANFASVDQVRQIADVLAHFHECSRGYEADGAEMVFDLEHLLRRRTEDLQAMLAVAQARRDADRFDRLLASSASRLREAAEESVRLISDTRCQSFLAADEGVPGVCHLDVIPENFILHPRRGMTAIDFDLAAYAPRALDVSHLLRRALQRQQWRSEVAYTCFSAYNQVRPIDGPEYRVIQALMTFPYRTWRVARSHYRVGQAPGQLEELEACVDEADRRERFMEAFARQIH
ncbi:MAG: phosphotransferase [Alicyclobacillus sp.]|nr:phosphotransferase [Alicyclobacillus sp.]